MATERVRRHIDIPVELVERILLNLPLKSVSRFSTVCKSWNRMILGARFAQLYRGREMTVLRVGDEKALVCPLSIENATPFALPLTAEPYSDVSCGELRCVEFEKSLCLYNPSTRAYRKLPSPSCAPAIGSHLAGFRMSVYVYGLGYDSTANDYKVLKILREFNGNSEVYSLKSDCWRELSDSRREIQSCMPGNGDGNGGMALTTRGVFVNGCLHWLVRNSWRSVGGNKIETKIAVLSFHVSTDKFGAVAAPAPESLGRSFHRSDLCVLRGRLCVCVTYRRRFVVWEYNNNNNNNNNNNSGQGQGQGEGEYYWSKDLEIDYTRIYPLCYATRLQPLYFYDNDRNLIKAVTCCTDIGKIFIYKDEDGESSVVESKFGGGGGYGYGIVDSFSYVESLVSPFPPFPSKDKEDKEEERCREREGMVEREGKGMGRNGGSFVWVWDLWAPWRGKYPEPTNEELYLIKPFLCEIKLEDDDFVEQECRSWMRFKNRLRCPNLRERIIQFIRQVRQTKGYDVDGDIDFSVSSTWKKYAIFIPLGLDNERNYNEAMAATKFAIGEINAHMALMKYDKRYELVSVVKLVSTRTFKLLLTFSAKEIATQDLATFQAMLCYVKSPTPTPTFKLNEWKFKPLPIHKI